MFLELSQLINQAALSKVVLVIQPEGNNRFSVLVNSTPNSGDAKVPKLRQALASELCVEGTVSELDEGFFPHLASFTDSFVESALIANTAEVIKQQSDNTKEVTENSSATNTASESLKDAVSESSETTVGNSIDDDWS